MVPSMSWATHHFRCRCASKDRAGNKGPGAESVVWAMYYLAYPSFTAPAPFSRPPFLSRPLFLARVRRGRYRSRAR